MALANAPEPMAAADPAVEYEMRHTAWHKAMADFDYVAMLVDDDPDPVTKDSIRDLRQYLFDQEPDRPETWDGRRDGRIGDEPDRGQGLAEYALILSLIAVVAIGILAFLGTQIVGLLSTVGASIAG